MAASLMKKKQKEVERHTGSGRLIVKGEPAPYWRHQPASADDDEQRRAPRSGAELWAKARAVKTQVTLTRRWHTDVDKWYKRLWLTCKGSHTLLAGLFFRGTVGFSRAQTVMARRDLSPPHPHPHPHRPASVSARRTSRLISPRLSLDVLDVRRFCPIRSCWRLWSSACSTLRIPRRASR